MSVTIPPLLTYLHGVPCKRYARRSTGLKYRGTTNGEFGSQRGLKKSAKSKLETIVYGEVNSVKKHNYKIWLNDGVY